MRTPSCITQAPAEGLSKEPKGSVWERGAHRQAGALLDALSLRIMLGEVDSLIVKVLVTVLLLSILVIIHEGGHYLAARAFGMRVLRYSIGFGPTLFRYQPKNSPTVFQVAAIPFLAYVQIAGMNPHEEVDWDDPDLYPNKSLFARFTTIAAGPLANYLTASAIVFGLAMANSLPQTRAVEPMTIGPV